MKKLKQLTQLKIMDSTEKGKQGELAKYQKEAADIERQQLQNRLIRKQIRSLEQQELRERQQQSRHQQQELREQQLNLRDRKQARMNLFWQIVGAIGVIATIISLFL
ncbi:MAG TPA: hypothetical protein VG737_11070 [Cyclobacteriaceae bacterium]|nr:hypothetical protein [Cyclobacteriaceae bacterium]